MTPELTSLSISLFSFDKADDLPEVKLFMF